MRWMPYISASGCQANFRISQLVLGNILVAPTLAGFHHAETGSPFSVARNAATLPPKPEPTVIADEHCIVETCGRHFFLPSEVSGSFRYPHTRTWILPFCSRTS